MRIAILGNAGSGKSTLARRLSATHDLPLHEMDRLMWRPDWTPAPAADYGAAHAEILARDRWVIDGMGLKDSLPLRLARATHVVFCDFPIWQNYWLLSQRQAAWTAGQLDHPPGGQATPPNTRDLFAFVWKIDQTFMPDLRRMVADADTPDRHVIRLTDIDALDGLHLP